jgi:tRNA-specific 2-thiouridylase
MNNSTANRKKPGSVGVAMSGGVDSSVTAALLQEQGYEVHGFFMALAQPDLDLQIARVRKVADYLKISLTVVDLARIFQQHVLDYCSTMYCRGRTPNPCMVCNATVKFGRLLEEIMAYGLDFQATGHYVRVIHEPGGTSRLLKGIDPKKDQSYFLGCLQQRQINRLQTPLGEYTKARVYRLAEKIGLKGLHGRESQDVCFLQGRDLGTFLAERLQRPSAPGPIITRDNAIIGRHRGLINFTVGQRRGLGIPDATPYYVLGLDVLHNRVIVGKKEDLLQDGLKVQNINWLAGMEPELPREFSVKIRYRHRAAAAIIDRAAPGPDSRLQIRFHAPQGAITPGQFAVFYQEDEVIGSGEICGMEARGDEHRKE